MIITFDSKRILFKEESLLYEFDLQSGDYSTYLQKLFNQWYLILDTICEGEIIYLPYSADDESISCLKAEKKEQTLYLRCVDIIYPGYEMNWENILSFAKSTELKIGHEFPEYFGIFPFFDFLNALKAATHVQ